MKHAQSPEADRVVSEVERVASGLVGRIGVAAREIDGNEVLAINGDEPFVMASTFKVAIAVAVLDRVDQGQLSLEQLADVTPDMMVAGDNVIATNFVHPGLKLSVANLIETMITESDNTAADLCMDLAGGPAMWPTTSATSPCPTADASPLPYSRRVASDPRPTGTGPSPRQRVRCTTISIGCHGRHADRHEGSPGQ